MKSAAQHDLSRRKWLRIVATSSLCIGSVEAVCAQDAVSSCDDCGDLGFLPLKTRKPYYHIEGQAAPKAADAVPHRFCPKCRPGKKDQELIDEQSERFKSAMDANKKWEKETGFQLSRVEARHISIHTQMPAVECKEIALGFESYAAHVQDLTGTMELTRSRPENYEMMILLNEPPYHHFRTVMEKLYTREQLGDKWSIGRGMVAWDNPFIPFFFEKQETLRQRPPAHNVAFLGGRKQLALQTNHRSPTWLAEGYAEYSEFISLKKNIWRTVYNDNPAPAAGDWVSQVRQLAVARQLRPWQEQMKRELQDWDARDYLQTFGMVTFLIQSQPKKFISFTRRLRTGVDLTDALEEAYDKKLDQLEADGNKWIATGGGR